MMHLPAPGWATALAAALTQRLIRNYEYSGGFGVGFRYGSDDRPSVLVLYPLPVLVHDEEDTSRCEEVIPPYSVNVLELLQEFESSGRCRARAGEHEGFGDCLRVAGTYQGQPVELYLHHDCPDDIPPAKYRRLDGVVVDYNPPGGRRALCGTRSGRSGVVLRG